MTLTFEEYRSYDALGLAGLIASRKVTALEIAEAAIARAEAVNPKINAIVEPLYDQARAVADGPIAGPRSLGFLGR